MVIKNHDMVVEFYELVKEDYPDLTYEQIRDSIVYPWIYTRECMESDELPEIRLKYFGSFKVQQGRATFMQEDIKRRLFEGKITQKKHDEVKEKLENYLKDEL